MKEEIGSTLEDSKHRTAEMCVSWEEAWRTRRGSPEDRVHKESCMWHLLFPKINVMYPDGIGWDCDSLDRWKASKGKQGYALLLPGLSISCDSLRSYPLGFLPEDWGMEARWRHAIKSAVKLPIPCRVHRLPQRPRFLSLSPVRSPSICPPDVPPHD